MNTGVISVRYARALLKAACEQGIEDKVYAFMQTLAQKLPPSVRPPHDD